MIRVVNFLALHYKQHLNLSYLNYIVAPLYFFLSEKIYKVHDLHLLYYCFYHLVSIPAALRSIIFVTHHENFGLHQPV